MKKKTVIVTSAVALFCAAAALIVFIALRREGNTLSFTIIDRNSRAWVWDAEIVLQNRKIKAYYQSDNPPKEYTFTMLERGQYTLQVDAPHYESLTLDVDIHRGANVISAPIELRGLEIPDLQRFVIFVEKAGTFYQMELRPIGSDGSAVQHHPCLDLWIGMRITERLDTDENGGYARGRVLYQGQLDWQWLSTPEKVFRYRTSLPFERITESDSASYVIDYLIIVPRPREVDGEGLDHIMAEAPSLRDTEALTAFLDERSDLFDYFFFTSSDVDGI
jgi:hypothetical protein